MNTPVGGTTPAGFVKTSAAALSALLVVVLWTTAAMAAPTDAVQRWEHESGATLYLVEKHDLPYVTVSVALRTGALWDPEGKPGLTRMTASLMSRGAGGLDRKQIDAQLDRLGADLEIDTTQTTVSMDLDGLSRNIDDVVKILGDVLQRPDFKADELVRLKREMESEVLRVRDNDRSLNRRFFWQYLYGAHPYGRPSSGTLAGIKAIKLADIKAFYKTHFVASNVILGFSGDVTREQAEAMATKMLGQLPKGQPPTIELPGVPTPRGRQVLLVDKPDRTQNQILIGHMGPKANAEDLYALEVANTLFGGTFTARLNQEVRDKRGLSYGAYSHLYPDRFTGSFSMWTFPAAADGVKTVSLLMSLYEEFATTPLTQEQVEFSKRYLINSFAFRIDTPSKLLTESIRAEVEGRPLDYLATYTQRIKAVTTEQTNAAIKAHMDPDNFLLVMLCTAAGFEEPMKAQPKVTTVRVVPYNKPF